MSIWLQPKQDHTRGKVTEILFIFYSRQGDRSFVFIYFSLMSFFLKVLYLLWFINSVLCVGHKVLHHNDNKTASSGVGCSRPEHGRRLCPAHSGCLKEVCQYLYSGGGTCSPNDVCAEELQECASLIDCFFFSFYYLRRNCRGLQKSSGQNQLHRITFEHFSPQTGVVSV